MKNFLKKRNAVTILVIALVLFAIGVGTTLAFVMMESDPVTNTFKAAKIDVKLEENFKDNVKSSIKVTNQGDVSAFIRVNLISFRVNEKGEHIGGEAAIPDFTLGEGWITDGNGMYYYQKPVAAGNSAPDLIKNGVEGKTGIVLVEYTDADGGRQEIDVIAEAIQADPGSAASTAWNVKVNDGVIESVAKD